LHNPKIMFSDFLKKRFGLFMLDSGSRFLLKLISSACNVYVTGVLIAVLGKDQFGVYRSASASVGFLSLASAGVAGASFGLVVRYLTRGDYPSVNAVVTRALKHLWLAGGVLLLLSIPSGFALAYAYNISPAMRESFVYAAALTAAAMALGFFSAPFIWVIQARQREYVLNFLHIPLALTAPILMIVMSKWHPMGWAPCIATAIIALAGCILCIGTSIWMYRSWICWSSVKTGDDVGKRTGYSMLEQLGGVILAQAVIWSATFHSGVASVAQLVVTMTFFAFTKDFLQTLASTLVTPVGSLFHGGQRERAAEAWYDASVWIMALAVSVAVILVAMNSRIIASWVGASNFAGESINILLALSFIIVAANVVSVQVLYAVDGYSERARLMLLEGILTAALGFLLGSYYGLSGTLAGACIAQIVSLCTFPIMISKRLVINISGFYLISLRIIVSGLPTIWLSYTFIKKTNITNTFIGNIIESAFLGFIVLTVIVIFGITTPTKNRLLARFSFQTS
jgi:hypothetical protein